MLRNLHRLAALSLSDQLALARALAWTALVDVGLRLARLEAVARWCRVELDFGRERPTETTARSPGLDEPEARFARATATVARHWPLGGACLRRSLVLGRFLSARSPHLRIGVAKTDEGFAAHAWLEIDSMPLADGDWAVFRPLHRVSELPPLRFSGC